MFYHSLTGNGGTTPTEDLEPVLLWTNPSPTSDFTAQTVSLDLSDYAGVIVEFIKSTTSNKINTRLYAKKNEDVDGIFGAGSYYVKGDSNTARGISVTDTGVTFAEGYGNMSLNNKTSIPIRIYGVKNYVVEPQIGNLLWTNPAPAASFGAQKISVDLSNAKGVIIECMISGNTQLPNCRTLIYKGEASFGIGYTEGTIPSSRNVTEVEDGGVTIGTAYLGTSEDVNTLIPY